MTARLAPELELEHRQHATRNARRWLRADLARAGALIEWLGVGIALNSERVKPEIECRSSRAFEQPAAVAAPDQQRIDEQMSKLHHLVGHALERIETDDVAPELHHLDRVMVENVRADRQLRATLLHEVGWIAPDGLGSEREIRQELALVDSRAAEHENGA